MKYQNYTALDFVKDEAFQKWVKNPDEKSDFYWESWMQNHKDKKHIVLEAREILTSISFPAQKASQADMDDIFEKVIRNERPVSIEMSEERSRRRSLEVKRILAVAASISLLITFSVVFYVLHQSPVEIRQSSVPKENVKENPAGRKRTFQLADGSAIILNASSKLRIADNFGVEKREVYLEGEAFFEISKDPQKPFIVHTGNVSTLVTGTVFNVNAYHDKSNITIAVMEGSVSTILYHDAGSDTLMLQRSDMAVYDKAGSNLSKTSFNYLEVTGWKDGIIYFDNANSSEVFSYLERWYGVDIYAKDQDKIMGAFHGEFKNEILDNVLTAISKALRFDYQINKDGTEVYIKPKRNEYE
ncbi:MAG: FecR domain-containing protein [Cytophagales bacterium]|nr:FecR domain-containing protein [Cytophagales bacterium]